MEERFRTAWLAQCREMEALGLKTGGIRAQIDKFGALPAARRMLSRGSQGFRELEKLGRLDLSLEALVLKSKFGSLFTDEEANACLEALLEAGYYG